MLAPYKSVQYGSNPTLTTRSLPPNLVGWTAPAGIHLSTAQDERCIIAHIVSQDKHDARLESWTVEGG